MNREDALAEFGRQMRETRASQREAIALAVPALERLVKVCAARTGQSYTLRGLLYSLWNGQPVGLVDVVTLDFSLKRDFAAVLLGFGCEPGGVAAFYYDAVSGAFKAAGLFEWFIEASTAPDEA